MLKRPRSIPSDPGVYIFRRDKTPLYVGKAANLKKRVSSYFKKNSGWKVERLLHEATRLEFIRLGSEIEALIKEAELIKTHIPKFNILLRDDKNYLYVALTAPSRHSNVLKNIGMDKKDRNKDSSPQHSNILKNVGMLRTVEFPRFYFTHQPERGVTRIGPFVEATLVKEAMRLLRRAFPFCSCKKPHLGLCVNAQIGRCPGYCCVKDRIPTATERREYERNIDSIVSILSGKRSLILKQLKAAMKEASRNQEYEEAAKYRDRIFAIETLERHRGIARKLRGETPYFKIERVLKSVLNTGDPIQRIEGYDISNIAGTDSAGSMVVFEEGRPNKSQYRKFRIKTVTGPDDLASHKEVIRRRLFHEEWQFPDLMLIDGGKSQLRAAAAVLTTPHARRIKLVALSKPPRKFFSRAPSGPGQNEDTLFVLGRARPIPIRRLPPEVRHFLQRIRDESHRFAKSYHALLRKKSVAASRF